MQESLQVRYVMKIQPEKSSALVLPLILFYLPLHLHDTVMGGDCMPSFWRNSGSDRVLMPLPSLLLLTPPASPQSPTGLQGPQTALTDSGLSLPLFSLPVSCSAFYSYISLSNKDSVASKIFQHIKLL